MRVDHTLEPIFDENSKILILGSFPSVKSRENMMYYSHPQNRFWKILSILFNEEIIDRKAFVLNHRIALWDVISSCEIMGSSDSSIRNVIPNDINYILKNSKVCKVFTTGRKAFDLYNRYIKNSIGVNAYLLSSTSPANAMKKIDDLVSEYKIILEFLK